MTMITRMICCSTCNKVMPITSFNRDDPVLKCGHTQHYVDNPGFDKIESRIIALIRAGRTVGEAIEEITQL